MSGIYIKGMEMPKSCFECFAYNADYTYCALYSYGIPARHSLKQYEKPEWCELIEVPKHGDLIDRDMVLEKAWDVETFVDAVKYAPTIIEAEE